MNARAKRAWGDTFRSLHVRNFRLFFVGQTISQIGNWLTMVAVALWVLDLTGNGFAVGVLVACQFAPVLLHRAVGRADRRPQRQAQAADDRPGCSPWRSRSDWPLLAFLGNPPLIAIYLVCLAGGFATAFDNPARRSFVVEMVPRGATCRTRSA